LEGCGKDILLTLDLWGYLEVFKKLMSFWPRNKYLATPKDICGQRLHKICCGLWQQLFEISHNKKTSRRFPANIGLMTKMIVIVILVQKKPL